MLAVTENFLKIKKKKFRNITTDFFEGALQITK